MARGQMLNERVSGFVYRLPQSLSSDINRELPAVRVYQSASSTTLCVCLSSCTQCQACAKVTCLQLVTFEAVGACDEIVTLVAM